MMPFILALCLSATPPAQNQLDYTAMLARVENGEVVVVHVNQKKRSDQQGVAIEWPGKEPGVLRFFKDTTGKIMMEPVATPGVSPTVTFRQAGVPVHAGHNCPVCRRSQYVISGWNRDGSHTHTCSAGHSWRH